MRDVSNTFLYVPLVTIKINIVFRKSRDQYTDYFGWCHLPMVAIAATFREARDDS